MKYSARVTTAATVLYLVSIPAVPVFAQTVANYDGAYAGQMTLIENTARGRGTGCLGGPFNNTMTIRNGAVSLVYNPTYHYVLNGTVKADGTVAASGTSSSGGTSLTGRIQGSTFTGEVGSGMCRYSLQLTKR